MSCTPGRRMWYFWLSEMFGFLSAREVIWESAFWSAGCNAWFHTETVAIWTVGWWKTDSVSLFINVSMGLFLWRILIMNILINWGVLTSWCLAHLENMLLIFVFVTLRNEKKGWRDGSVVRSNFLPEDPSLFPSNHVTWLTAACNSSSMELQCLWSLCAPALTCTYLHKHMHIQSQRLWIWERAKGWKRKEENNAITF